MSLTLLPRVTIRTKLMLGYAAAFALVVGVGIFGLVQLHAVNELAREAREVWLPKIDALAHVEERIRQHRLLAAKLVQSTEFRNLAAVGKDMRGQEAAIDAELDNYAQGAVLRDGENEDFGRLRKSWAFYLDMLESVAGKLEAGELIAGFDRFERVSVPLYRDSLDQLARLKARVRQGGETAEERAGNAYRLALRLIVAISILAALAGWAATQWTSRSISVPIIRVSEAMQRLAEGDYDAAIAEGPVRHDEIGVLIGAVAGYRDSLLRGRELAELAERERQRLWEAIGNMPLGLAMFDAAQCLIICNMRYAEMYQLPDALAAPGTPLKAILQARVKSGLLAGGGSDGGAVDILALTASPEPAQLFVELNDGRSISVIYQPTPDGGWVSTHEDITERRRNEARIRHMARHDALTDLPNRVMIREHIERALEQNEPGATIAVLCMDLDRFKTVNDSLGHPVGDRLLQAVAGRIRETIRDTDTAARFGGDEFAIVQTGAAQPQGATALAARLIEALGAPFDVGGNRLDIGCSIGVSLAPGDGDDGDELIKKADLALYRAKLDGRGAYRFFEPEIDARMQARLTLEADLRRALAAHEFHLHYQPLVELETGRVIGIEALLRWSHPRRGMVAPADFIPLAEETGLIVPIGEWVMRRACADASAWPEAISIAVNLSAVQFRNDGIVGVVTSALAASGLPPERLELEITESVLLHDNEAVLAILHQLRALGVRVSLDDFGTGYSSLSYLRSFPFDKIKIDQSFVRNISENSQSLAIVQAVTSLGATLGMVTTAEGVETRDQLEHLRSQGCKEVQGFYFGQPRPAEELEAMLGISKSAQEKGMVA